MVYNIIQQHKGFIDVYSEIGLGSRFNVFLPVYSKDEEDVSEVVMQKIPRGEGLILVVDDEALLRNLARTILEEMGYTVLLAKDGIEGVQVFREKHKEIKAVLLDMVMPGKSGEEAFVEMKAIDPEIKVLLASGFKLDERVQTVLNLGAKDFLQKPYNIEKLATKIDSIIRG